MEVVAVVDLVQVEAELVGIADMNQNLVSRLWFEMCVAFKVLLYHCYRYADSWIFFCL